MKKIMKKALSLVLALVMVFTLAPMTAKAAGTGTKTDPIEVSATETITSNGTGQAVYYVYNAPVAATYEITVTGSMGVDSFGTKVQSPRGEMDNYAFNNSLSIFVEGTDKVVFNLFDYESQQLSITIEMIEGTEVGGGATGVTPEDAIELTENPAYATVPGAGMVYYKVSVEEGAAYTLSLYNRTGAAFDLYMLNPRTGTYGYYNSSDNGLLEAYVTAESTEYIFAIGNPGDVEVAVQVTMAKEGGDDEGGEDEGGEEGGTLGTTAAPDSLVMNEEITTLLDGTGTYWYKWVAAVDGKITVTPGVCTAGWTASVFKGADLSEYVGYYDADNNTTFDIIVSADDVVLIGINNLNWEEGTVKFTATFTEGQFTAPEEDDDDEDLGGETEVNFEMSDTAILVGENALPGPSNFAYTYTVHEFAPGETGKYTFTTSDSYIGIVSTNGMWINVGNPGEEYNTDVVPALVVVEDEIVWSCTDVSQSIWIAVMPFGNSSNINVTREDLVIEEIPSQNAYATISLSPYSFKGELKDLKSVMYGLADKEIGICIDDDGYYHVASIEDFDEDGNYAGEKAIDELPLVLVKLNDSVLSLESAIGYGNVKYVEYDGDDNAQYILYFNNMIEEYLACAATTDKLYPATEDLDRLMILAGADQGWYEEGGAVQAAYANDKVPADLLPAFAMYYLEQDIVTLDKEDQVVDKDVMADLIEDNKTNGTVVNTTAKNDKNEEVTVTFTFAADTMKPVEGKEEYSFNVSLIESYDKATEDKAEIEKDDFVLRVNFEYTGELPAEATIYIPVPAEYINTTLYYYQILADGTLKYVCDAPVDGAGNAKVTQDHCSDYVLLAEKIVEDTVAPGGTTTGDSTNFALWIAVLGLGIAAIAGSVVMKKREF